MTTYRCAIHDADEDVPNDDAFLVCFECSHVYRTEADLEREWAETYPDGVRETARTISRLYCPLCLHDFP